MPGFPVDGHIYTYIYIHTLLLHYVACIGDTFPDKIQNFNKKKKKKKKKKLAGFSSYDHVVIIGNPIIKLR